MFSTYTESWSRPYRHPGVIEVPKPIPVIHRNVVLGQARTKVGALRIAGRRLVRDYPEREAFNACHIDWWENGEINHGPAWAVGIHMAR